MLRGSIHRYNVSLFFFEFVPLPKLRGVVDKKKRRLNLFLEYRLVRKIRQVKHISALVNPLSANITKWSNTLKQFVGKLPRSVGYFVLSKCI